MATGIIVLSLQQRIRISHHQSFRRMERSPVFSYELNVWFVPIFLHPTRNDPTRAHDSAGGNLVEQPKFYSPSQNDEPMHTPQKYPLDFRKILIWTPSLFKQFGVGPTQRFLWAIVWSKLLVSCLWNYHAPFSKVLLVANICCWKTKSLTTKCGAFTTYNFRTIRFLDPRYFAESHYLINEC